jgi:hypothetical protein
MAGEIPRDRVREVPRRFTSRHELVRTRIAALEARDEIVASMMGVEDSPLEAAVDVIPVMKIPRVRSGDRAKREAVVLNAGLTSTPEAQKGSLKYWKELFRRNRGKLGRFLTTVSHKGKFNPTILAAVLNSEAADRKATKTSIIHQAN